MVIYSVGLDCIFLLIHLFVCLFIFFNLKVWDHIPAKSIAVTDEKITSVKTKFKNASKNILHKI